MASFDLLYLLSKILKRRADKQINQSDGQSLTNLQNFLDLCNSMFDDTKYDHLSLRLSLSLIASLLVSSFVICLFMRYRSKNVSKSIYYLTQDLSLSFLLFVDVIPLPCSFSPQPVHRSCYNACTVFI
jgi:hypothetical protein